MVYTPTGCVHRVATHLDIAPQAGQLAPSNRIWGGRNTIKSIADNSNIFKALQIHAIQHCKYMQYSIANTCNTALQIHAIQHCKYMQCSIANTCNTALQIHAIQHCKYMQYSIANTCNTALQIHAIQHCKYMQYSIALSQCY